MTPDSKVHDETIPAPAQEQNNGRRLSELGHLAAVIAHDFNNVLSIIHCCASMLRVLPGLTPEHGRELDDLDDAVEHGSGLVQQVFAYGRQKSSQVGAIDINKVIAQMDWVMRRLGRNNVTLDYVLARNLGHMKADEVQVEQVILNLAINARDAMPEGGQLLIETSNVCEDTGLGAIIPPIPPGDYVRLAVSDNGLGIPKEVQARLFEPFFTTKQAGTGLGLFSVQRIVQQCGGHIRIHSSPGNGTTFEIYFPRTDLA